jgi:hypothetical protein
MYLKQSRYKSGRVYLSIVEGFRSLGKNKMRTVEKCGYLDELEKLYEDPVAHFKARAQKLTEEHARENEPVILEFMPKEKIDMRAENVKHLGHAILSHYYHKLKLDRFWDNRRMNGNFDYNPNAIFKLLTYSRITSPGSKAQAYRDREAFVDKMDFSADDMYRCLSFFSSYERGLIDWIDKEIRGFRRRNTTSIYYDVTNYYFEIEAEDDLRRRGVSKEHRPNPIVQMGLMLDSCGIPLDYQLFESNVNDCLTLMPVLKDLRARHNTDRVIVVADKGLNTSDNIAANILDGNGFVFSQSVVRATKDLKAWVVSADGYRGSEDFRIKERLVTKKITVTGADGKKKRVDVEVKEVAFWSRDFDVRSKAERAKVIEKSMAALKRGGVGAAKAHTALKYVTDTAVVAETGEAANHVYDLDVNKIKADEEMDGYYCIATSELDKSAEEIIDIYRGLWRIEETFKVTKSTLEARPVYVSRHDRIHAHFMTCYVALVILRLIQGDLKWKHSADEIAGDIANMDGSLMKRNYYLFNYRTHLTDKLGKLCGLDLSRKILSTKDMKDIFARTKKK